MKKNIGNNDRVIRMTIALIIVILYFANEIEGTLAYILLVVASVLVLTSLFGRCLLYSLFGINTRSTKTT